MSCDSCLDESLVHDGGVSFRNVRVAAALTAMLRYYTRVELDLIPIIRVVIPEPSVVLTAATARLPEERHLWDLVKGEQTVGHRY